MNIKLKHHLQFGIVILFFNHFAFAIQEFETVVKDTAFNSSSRIVIDKEEIEKSHTKSLTSLLATQANISVAQSNFTPSSIYLRGGDSSHVLILVDGVPFYDASSVQRTINLNSLDIRSIQRVEVIKGSQSVLYGGQALSGVIKIETIPVDFSAKGDVKAEIGSFSYSGASGGYLQPVTDHSAISFRGSYSQKKDPSPVLDSTQTYPTSLGTAEGAYIFRSPEVHALLKAQTSFDKTLIATTDFPSYKAADADRFETSTYQMNVTGVLQMPNHYFQPLLSVSIQKSAKLFEQDYAAASGNPTKQDYQGQLIALRYDMTALQLEKILQIKLGASYNSEKMIYHDLDSTKTQTVLKVDESLEREGVYLKIQSEAIENIEVEVGARADYNRAKNQILTEQVGLTFFKNVKLEYSTGFKTPSLFQLFSDYGNTNLSPEKSVSYSLSYDKKWNSDLFSSLTFFHNKFENLIIIKGSPQKYENVDSSETKGVEFSTFWNDQVNQLQYNLSLGYQEPYDQSQKTWLVRRPLRTASVKVRKQLQDIQVGVEVLHNGDRRDKTSNTTYGTIDAYTLMNLSADYSPYQNLTFFSRVENLSNQKYQSSYGFYDEGLSATLGAEFDF